MKVKKKASPFFWGENLMEKVGPQEKRLCFSLLFFVERFNLVPIQFLISIDFQMFVSFIMHFLQSDAFPPQIPTNYTQRE